MKVKRVRTGDLRPGMLVANDIYAINGTLLALKDSIVNERMIALLQRAYIQAINIRQTDLLDDTEGFATRKFTETFDRIHNDIKDTFEKVVVDKEVNTKEIVEELESLMVEAGNSYDLLNMLLDMRKISGGIYYHAIEVAMISRVLGGWLDMPKEDVALLEVAGLFHDIGKCRIDPKILNKKESLSRSEYETVRQHAIEGYKIVRDKNLDGRIKQAVLSHHERCDGSGYPLGVKANKIGAFPRVVAIADVYAAMLEKRPYRKRSYSPFEIVGYLEQDCVGKFDAEYLMSFLSRILDAYLHRQVKLDNGIVGEVIFINKSNPSKPLLKILGGYLDLSLTPEISIVEVL